MSGLRVPFIPAAKSAFTKPVSVFGSPRSVQLPITSWGVRAFSGYRSATDAVLEAHHTVKRDAEMLGQILDSDQASNNLKGMMNCTLSATGSIGLQMMLEKSDALIHAAEHPDTKQSRKMLKKIIAARGGKLTRKDAAKLCFACVNNGNATNIDLLIPHMDQSDLPRVLEALVNCGDLEVLKAVAETMAFSKEKCKAPFAKISPAIKAAFERAHYHIFDWFNTCLFAAMQRGGAEASYATRLLHDTLSLSFDVALEEKTAHLLNRATSHLNFFVHEGDCISDLDAWRLASKALIGAAERKISHLGDSLPITLRLWDRLSKEEQSSEGVSPRLLFHRLMEHGYIEAMCDFIGHSALVEIDLWNDALLEDMASLKSLLDAKVLTVDAVFQGMESAAKTQNTEAFLTLLKAFVEFGDAATRSLMYRVKLRGVVESLIENRHDYLELPASNTHGLLDVKHALKSACQLGKTPTVAFLLSFSDVALDVDTVKQVAQLGNEGLRDKALEFLAKEAQEGMKPGATPKQAELFRKFPEVCRDVGYEAPEASAS